MHESEKLKKPNGICHHCGAPAVPGGCYCPACYGGVMHPEGLPMVPDDPDDPYREFNAEAAIYLADQQMPRYVGWAIQENEKARAERRHAQAMSELDKKIKEEQQVKVSPQSLQAKLSSLPPGSLKRSLVFDFAAIEEAYERTGHQARALAKRPNVETPEGEPSRLA